FEKIESELPKLEEQKAQMEAELSSGTLSVEELTATANKIGEIIDQIDEMTMRWLELSEKGNI
ncbi:MAG: ABC transporter C-terminal domain-containing protein, partial [Rikenellaceae bacterium]